MFWNIRKRRKNRWKIENEGFHIQKNHRYDITHGNGKNHHALKVHDLLVQIADILLQLYENRSIWVKKLEKTIKKLSRASNKRGYLQQEMQM